MTKPNPVPEISETELFRFHERYEDDANGCSVWTGYISTNGYGRLMINGKQLTAHRVAYFLNYGSIDDSMVIDHLCRNRACVNPDHLEMVTQQVNVRRGELGELSTERTHCSLGHALRGYNKMPNGRGEGFHCRTCNRDYMREYMRMRRNAST